MQNRCTESKNLIRKLYATISTSCLRMYNLTDTKYIRVGRESDGGYVLANYIFECDELWSFGVGGDISFELQLAKGGVKCYLFDFTVDEIPKAHENISFYKLGLGDRNDGVMRTLPSLMKSYGESQGSDLNRVLKMDIEGWEWSVILGLPENLIDQFDQIVMECHYMCGMNIFRALRQRKAFYKLCRTHSLVHVHGNNVNRFVALKDKTVPYYLECTFVNKKHKLRRESRRFPTELDFPNVAKSDDIDLGIWN